MKFSYNWLQTHIIEPLPLPEKIHDVLFAHAFEVESMETVGSDTVFDINVLPNRAADCLSHRGMAKELAALLELNLVPLKSEIPPVARAAQFISITSGACLRYIAIKISGITLTETPEIIKSRLEAVGQQSINAVVDIANMLMLDLGQPIHIFDADNVDGGLVVRNAREGEKIITLSNEEKKLTPEMIVIADVLGPLAIAGVKGGKSAAVTEQTKNIIVEIANFDAKTIGKTARVLGLLTDAAKRYENNVPLTLIDDTVVACTGLLHTTVGGTIEWLEDTGGKLPEPRKIVCTSSEISAKLGVQLLPETVAAIFTRYQYSFVQDGEKFELTVPLSRPDIIGVHDIVEEIGRVYGFNTIEPAALPWKLSQEENSTFNIVMAIKIWLAREGFREVQTYTFVKTGELEVSYGAKGKSALRSNLSDLLKESYELNTKNAPLFGEQRIKLFEVGTVFFKDHEELRVATAENGTLQEMTMDAFLELHPEIKTINWRFVPFEKKPELFAPWSVYPFITRDLAVWVSSDTEKVTLEKIVQDFAAKNCIRPAALFDTFKKEGKTSVAYRFVFQSTEKTMTTEEVEKIFTTILEELKNNPQFEIR